MSFQPSPYFIFTVLSNINKACFPFFTEYVEQGYRQGPFVFHQTSENIINKKQAHKRISVTPNTLTKKGERYAFRSLLGCEQMFPVNPEMTTPGQKEEPSS